APFLGAGVLGEDVEDHRRAVDGGAAEQLLEVAALGRAELVVEHHGVRVDLEGHLAELVGLALADVGRGVGAVAALENSLGDVRTRGVDEQGELVEMGLGVVHRLGRDRDPHEHDALAYGPLNEAQEANTTVATCSAGPLRSTVSSPTSTSRSPPGLCTVTCLPTSPHACAAAAAAHVPVPHACVSPAPRSQTRKRSSSSPGPGAMNSTLMPPGRSCSSCGPRSATWTSSGSGQSKTRWGLPISTSRCCHPCDVRSRSGPRTAGPMSTEIPSSLTHTRFRPASVFTITSGPVTIPASTAARTMQRIPFPLISARPLSAFHSSKVRSAPALPGVALIRPSAPTPRWRSQTRRTKSASTAWLPSASTRIRTSFPRASYFSSFEGVTASSFPGARAKDREDRPTCPAT